MELQQRIGAVLYSVQNLAKEFRYCKNDEKFTLYLLERSEYWFPESRGLAVAVDLHELQQEPQVGEGWGICGLDTLTDQVQR